MERQVLLGPRFANIVPQRLKLRDDGTYSVEDASFPPFVNPLAFKGTSGKIACYLNQAGSHFILWDMDAARQHRRVFYHPDNNLPYMSVGFGHSAQGQTKIVLLAHVGISVRIKVHTAAGEGGDDSGGAIGADGHFVEDLTWSQWLQPLANNNFWPDLNQPARFLSGNRTMYFHGHVNGESSIVTYNVETHLMRTQNPPPHVGIPDARFGLGFGLDGELCATMFEPAEQGPQTLTVWSLRNGAWENIVVMLLDAAPAVDVAYPYLPICFFHGRVDGGVLHYIFLFNGHVVIRVRGPVLVNIPAQVETLRTMARPLITSMLPPVHYLSEPNRRIGDGWRPAGQERPRNYNAWQRSFLEKFDDNEVEAEAEAEAEA